MITVLHVNIRGKLNAHLKLYCGDNNVYALYD